MALPHIKNSKAGINRQEPLFKNLFEVYFSIPAALNDVVGVEDVAVLTEQVKSIDGLDSLTKTPATVDQTFMGTKRTYIGASIDDTSHEVKITLQLNMRNGTDNYIFKLFKNWNSLAYNMSTGTRTVKEDHVADFLRCVAFNRKGDIYKDITYHDVQLTGLTGISSFDYTATDIFELEVTFKSDWADDIDA